MWGGEKDCGESPSDEADTPQLLRPDLTGPAVTMVLCILMYSVFTPSL